MEAALHAGAGFVVEDLLNFTFDAAEEDDDDENQKTQKTGDLSSSFETSYSITQDPDDKSLSLPELAEEELEWLSDKDAFPPLETCLDILPDNPGIELNHQSPVSVLENSTTNAAIGCCGGRVLIPPHFPVKSRSKGRRRCRRGFSDLPGQHCWWLGQVGTKNTEKELPTTPPRRGRAAIGRRCQHCGAEKTPQWRAGPMGPKTLCNACGVRYKSGRLVPEYRPAGSPSFLALVHSNSHRKILEMRREKEVAGMVVNEACAYSVG